MRAESKLTPKRPKTVRFMELPMCALFYANSNGDGVDLTGEILMKVRDADKAVVVHPLPRAEGVLVDMSLLAHVTPLEIGGTVTLKQRES